MLSKPNTLIHVEDNPGIVALVRRLHTREISPHIPELQHYDCTDLALEAIAKNAQAIWGVISDGHIRGDHQAGIKVITAAQARRIPNMVIHTTKPERFREVLAPHAEIDVIGKDYEGIPTLRDWIHARIKRQGQKQQPDVT